MSSFTGADTAWSGRASLTCHRTRHIFRPLPLPRNPTGEFMAVVVVESPAKAKTINKYLGENYTVLASYGHVRDLPPKDGSVDPEHDFDMVWEVASDSQKHVRAIAEALAQDGSLILATDPDREGEAISWHLQEALKKRRALK